MRVTWSVVLATAAVCFLSASVVDAECPNGCSGNGDCMAKDMCECYKSFQGNDCADRTCLFGHAHVDTPKGDIDMDQDRESAGPILVNSQQFPEGTYEYFNQDAANEEAHFYMECSNKGICDRSTGLCQCFDGYEGNGCQRTTCPGRCNGHGTCESIRELGLKAGGTLFGAEGAAGPVTYDLWDSNSTYGCRCDPWYYGPDCNRRHCKVGVDPLFLSAGTPTYETFVVHAHALTGALTDDSWIRLRLFDYYGESYITQKIEVDDGAAGTVIEDAIKAVPNQTFRKIKCAAAGTAPFAGFLSVGFDAAASDGLSIVCQYTDNPGKMRIPEIAASNGLTDAFVATTSHQGWDDEWFTVKTKVVADPATTSTTATITADTDSEIAAVPVFIKIGPHILLATAKPSGTTLTLAYGITHTIGSGLNVFVAPTGLYTVTAGISITALAVGATEINAGATDPGVNYKAGTLLFLHNSFYTSQGVTKDVNNDYLIKLDKPFGGRSEDGVAIAAATTIYRVVVATDAKDKVYNYVSECSGRGLCASDTGVCTCFKGYTNDNCNTQNILAL